MGGCFAYPHPLNLSGRPNIHPGGTFGCETGHHREPGFDFVGRCPTLLDLEALFYAVVGLEMDAWVFDLDWHKDFELYTHPIGNWDFSLSQTGTVVIDPSPDSIEAPWVSTL